MSGAGTLKICILEARLTRDTDVIGKMDPYVIVSTRMQRFRTKTQDDAGLTPAWADEVIEIDVKYVGDDITFTVMDEDITSDDTVGSCTVKLTEFLGARGSKVADMDDWWAIHFRGEEAGHIHMKAHWIPLDSEELKPLPEAPKQPALQMSDGTAAPRNVEMQVPQQVVYSQPIPQQQMVQNNVMYYQQNYGMQPQQAQMMQQQQQVMYQQMMGGGYQFGRAF